MSDDPIQRYYQQMLEAKTSELRAIRGSRTWRWLNVLREWKYRWLDRLILRIAARTRVPVARTWRTTAGPSRDVVCLSIIDWDFRFQRPQQLMVRFAAAGHRVLYVRRGAGPVVEKRTGVVELSARDLTIAADALVIVQHPSWWPLVRNLANRVIEPRHEP